MTRRADAIARSPRLRGACAAARVRSRRDRQRHRAFRAGRVPSRPPGLVLRRAAARSDPRWGICGGLAAQPRRARRARAAGWPLHARDSRRTTSYQVIGAIKEVWSPASSPAARAATARAQLAHALVTLTVTEKGYCLAATARSISTHPDIPHDLAHPHAPASSSAISSKASRAARAGSPPLGDRELRQPRRQRHEARAVQPLSSRAQRDPALARWIESERRVSRARWSTASRPRRPTRCARACRAALGVHDRWPVQREAFAQWVIEDASAASDPDWARVGVTITADVAAYERAKLRLLNGAHSTLAYLGLLAGYETVAQAMSDADLVAFVRALMTRRHPADAATRRAASICATTSSDPAAVPQSGDRPSARADRLGRLAEAAVPPARHDRWTRSRPAAHRSAVRADRGMDALRPRASRCAASASIDPLADRLLEIGRDCARARSADVRALPRARAMFPADACARDPRFRAAAQRRLRRVADLRRARRLSA